MLGKAGSVKFVLFCCLMSKLAPEPGDKELNAAGCLTGSRNKAIQGMPGHLEFPESPSLPQSSLLFSEECLLIYQLRAIQI